MKNHLAVVAVALSLGLTLALDAEAKRLGGARSSGMQRQQTTQPATAPTTQPGSPAQAAPVAGTAAAAAAPAAAAAKRSWMGPIAGLAAGLGLAALASHFGFGEAMANMLMIGLLVMAALAIFGFIMRKRATAANAAAYAGAGAAAGGGSPGAGRPLLGTRIGSALGGGVPASQALGGAIPADFDAEGFARNAKAQFLHLQAANDARDLGKLRDYLSPEMFEVVREEIESRGDAPQKTEVFGLEARVLEVAEDADGYVVSVRFTGSIRDQHGAAPDDLDEVWHLTKPRTGPAGWVIAGIQQVTAG